MKNKELGLNDKMTFGKHKGSTIKYLIENEPLYLDWCVENVINFVLNDEADDYLEDKLIELLDSSLFETSPFGDPW